MRMHLPDWQYFINKPIPDQQSYIITERIGSGNNAHVFKAHSKDANNDIACKIIPVENLIGRDLEKPSWREEIDKANVLRSPISVRFWGVSEWQDPQNDIDCVVLCSDLIRGPSLERHIKKNKKTISVNFCEIFLKAMLSFIDNMQKHNVKHGDLHAKNILVEDYSDQLEGPDYAFRVTDFGVTNATSDAVFKDDYEQLAIVLKQLLENIDYQFISPQDQFTYNILNNHFLGRHLSEKDTTRDPLARNPRGLYQLLDEIDANFTKAQRETAKVELITPFDYLSCEQIGESHNLLQALYSDLFLGLNEIESRSNLVLTGPRGCGN